VKFGVVDPRSARAEIIDVPDLNDAMKLVKLDTRYIDHGNLIRDRAGGVAYFCYNFALFLPVQEQRYLSIGRRLIGGSIVLYAFDEKGETIDLVALPAITFYRDAAQVERAIANHFVDRPAIVVGCRWKDTVKKSMEAPK
jgi:hypothetical protein